MKKDVCIPTLFLALCLCMVMAVPTFAADDDTNVDVSSIISELKAYTPGDNQGIQPYSTSIPGAEWVFSDSGDYTGYFYDLRDSRMYTNYYFKSGFAYQVRCSAQAPRRSFTYGVRCIECRDDVQIGVTEYTPDTPNTMSGWTYASFFNNPHTGHKCVPYVENTSNGWGESKIPMKGEIFVTFALGR